MMPSSYEMTVAWSGTAMISTRVNRVGTTVRTVNTKLLPGGIDSGRRGFAVNVDVEERSVEELWSVFNLDVVQDGSYDRSAIMCPARVETGHAQYSDV